jgi:hypothetical protein
MNKSVVLVLMAVLLVAPTVAAFETTITVETHPSTWAMVRVFEAGNNLNLLQSFLDTQVGDTGIISFDLSTNRTPVDIEVYIKLERNGQSFVYKKFEEVSASEPINLFVMRGNPNAESNTTTITETENATTETNTTEELETTETLTEETGDSGTALTGNAIAGEGSAFKSYYIIVAVLVAGLIIGGLLFARQRMRAPSAPSIPPGAAAKAQLPAIVPAQQAQEQLTSDTLDSLKQELQETKAKLQQANTQMAKTKNQERMKELQQHIRDEEAELRRLEQEDSN